ALEAYALAYGWDFDDFVTSFGANGAPACGTGETCEWALPLGLVVTLTPTAEDGAAFLGWSCADGTAATDITIDDPTGPVGCTARFAFPLEITTETPPEAELGALYSTLIESENGIEPVSWDIAASSPFPAWFEFNAGTPGLLSGVPPASGTWSLTV